MLSVRILCLVIGYALGLFQTGVIYGKIHKFDIRQHGSGNSGMTNALRTQGWKAGVIVFLGRQSESSACSGHRLAGI